MTPEIGVIFIKSFAQAFSKACQIPKVKPLVELRRARNLFAYPKIRTGALTVHWTVNARETQLGGLPKGGSAALFINDLRFPQKACKWSRFRKPGM